MWCWIFDFLLSADFCASGDQLPRGNDLSVWTRWARVTNDSQQEYSTRVDASFFYGNLKILLCSSNKSINDITKHESKFHPGLNLLCYTVGLAIIATAFHMRHLTNPTNWASGQRSFKFGTENHQNSSFLSNRNDGKSAFVQLDYSSILSFPTCVGPTPVSPWVFTPFIATYNFVEMAAISLACLAVNSDRRWWLWFMLVISRDGRSILSGKVVV